MLRREILLKVLTGAFGVDLHDIGTEEKRKPRGDLARRLDRLNDAIKFAVAFHGFTAQDVQANPWTITGKILPDVIKKYGMEISDKQVCRHLKELF